MCHYFLRGGINSNVMKVVGKGNGNLVKSDLVKKVPGAPRFFTPRAKTTYKRLGNILIEAGVLKSRHLPTLEILAQNYDQWQSAIMAINKANRKKAMSGYIQKFTTGATNISPEVTLKEKAEKQIFICLKRFGLDPKSEKELDAGNQLQLPFTLDDILSNKRAV